MKKIFAIFMVVVLLFVMNSCAAADPSASASGTATETVTGNQSEFEAFEMELVGKCVVSNSGDIFYYYRETTTNVMYVTRYDYHAGGLTVMLNPETGLPLTYDRYMEIYDSKVEE